MKITIIGLLLITTPLALAMTPFDHDWYDARTTQMKFNFDYNQYDPILTNSIIVDSPGSGTGSGFVTYTNDMLSVGATTSYGTITGSHTGYALGSVGSMQAVDWSAGYETHFMFSAAFSQSSGSITNWPTNSLQVSSAVGIFDINSTGINNGIGIGVHQNTSGLSSWAAAPPFVFVANNGSLTTYGGANGDSMPNGTFPTNPADLNLYRIVVSDKITGPIRFEFYDGSTNTWQVIHQIINNQSTLNLPQLRTLQLPLNAFTVYNYSITSSGQPVASLNIQTAGWHLMTVGDDQEVQRRTFASFSGSIPASATESHVMTIENSGIAGAKTNHVTIRLKSLGVSGSHLAWFQLYKNAIVTGTSYSPINSNNSVTQVTTSGTYTIGTGTRVFSSVSNPHMGNVPTFDSDEIRLFVYPGETLTITSLLPYDTSDNVFASITWDELF